MVSAGWRTAPSLRLTTPPSIAEFLRYAVGWAVSALNYGLFVIVLLWPAIEPLVALFVSSLMAMFFAYLGMRFAAFKVRGS